MRVAKLVVWEGVRGRQSCGCFPRSQLAGGEGKHHTMFVSERKRVLLIGTCTSEGVLGQSSQLISQIAGYSCSTTQR